MRIVIQAVGRAWGMYENVSWKLGGKQQKYNRQDMY